MARIGRPPKFYQMKNGVVSIEDLFLYAPEDTIPVKQLNRFLHLCDVMLGEMELEALTPADIDEVAQYNRTRLLKDFIISNMTNPKGPDGSEEIIDQITDMGLITQLEKLDKQMNVSKENLLVRRSDRGPVGLKGGKSLSDLARELDETPKRLLDLEKKNKEELEKFQSAHHDSDPLKFIEEPISQPIKDE